MKLVLKVLKLTVEEEMVGERDPPIQESGQSAPTARVNTEGVIGNGQY